MYMVDTKNYRFNKCQIGTVGATNLQVLKDAPGAAAACLSRLTNPQDPQRVETSIGVARKIEAGVPVLEPCYPLDARGAGRLSRLPRHGSRFG